MINCIKCFLEVIKIQERGINDLIYLTDLRRCYCVVKCSGTITRSDSSTLQNDYLLLLHYVYDEGF